MWTVYRWEEGMVLTGLAHGFTSGISTIGCDAFNGWDLFVYFFKLYLLLDLLIIGLDLMINRLFQKIYNKRQKK